MAFGIGCGMISWSGQSFAAEDATGAAGQTSRHLKAKVSLLLNDGFVCQATVQTPAGFEPSKDPVVILGDFPHVAIGDQWEGDGFPAGYYQYRELNGSNRTVSAYATTKLAAENHVSAPAPAPDLREPPSTTITPPFGLKWGTKADHMQTLLKGAHGKITAQEQEDGKSIWHVEGLIQDNLKETQFTFASEALAGVTLIYTPREATPAKMADLYRTVRGRIASRFGEPKKESVDGQGNAKAEPSEAGVGGHVREAEWQKQDTGLRLTYLPSEGTRPDQLKVEYLGHVSAP